jgi:hypothetical protein
MCDEVMEFQKRGRYVLMYMKTKELGAKETQGIQNIGIQGSQGNKIVEQIQVMKIWGNYITELHDRTNRPVTREVEPKEEVDADEKGPYILQSKVE